MKQIRNVRLSLGSPWTPVVKNLIIANTIVFLSLLLVGNQVDPNFGTSYRNLIVGLLGVEPQAVIHHFTLWQLVSYLFVHEAFYHYLFNMLGLWWFGSDVERALGSRAFLRYYLFTGMGAGFVSVLMGVPTIGASGSIYGLLLAYGLLFPNRVLYLYFVIPIKAKYCVILFGLIELLALLGVNSTINHYAHLAGIFFGMLWFLYWSKRSVIIMKFREYQKRRRRKKFRVISTEATETEEEPFNPYDDRNKTIH